MQRSILMGVMVFAIVFSFIQPPVKNAPIAYTDVNAQCEPGQFCNYLPVIASQNTFDEVLLPLQNGDFELGNNYWITSPSWIISGYGARNGNYGADFYERQSITQTVGISPDHPYITFWYSIQALSLSAYCENFQLKVNGDTVWSRCAAADDCSVDWTKATIDLRKYARKNATIHFILDNPCDRTFNSQARLDDISFTNAP